MRQYKALIAENDNFETSSLVSLSKTDYDNLKLLRQYLPEEKEEYDENEKEAILKYNNFIEDLRVKSKSSSIQVDIALKK